jgi:hypothetical protein
MKSPALFLPLIALSLLVGAPAMAQQSSATAATDTWKPAPVPAPAATAAAAWAEPAATPLPRPEPPAASDTFKFKKIGPEPLQSPYPASRDVGKPVRPPGRDGDPPVNCAMTPHDPECR